jgi:hypothetical protein
VGGGGVVVVVVVVLSDSMSRTELHGVRLV